MAENSKNDTIPYLLLWLAAVELKNCGKVGFSGYPLLFPRLVKVRGKNRIIC